MLKQLTVLSEVIMNDPKALERFDNLSPDVQAKYAKRTFAVVGWAITLFSLWAILNIKWPKSVRVERAEIYDPQAEVVNYLQENKVTLADIQYFLDNDLRGKRLQEEFIYQGRPLRLKDMDPVLLQKILNYMNSVGILPEIAQDKDVPKAIPLNLTQ